MEGQEKYGGVKVGGQVHKKKERDFFLQSKGREKIEGQKARRGDKWHTNVYNYCYTFNDLQCWLTPTLKSMLISMVMSRNVIHVDANMILYIASTKLNTNIDNALVQCKLEATNTTRKNNFNIAKLTSILS